VACGGAAATVDMSLFPPGIPLNQTGTFSLLGAPIGDGSFCNQFTTSERVAKALPLLDALAVLPDAQTALLLLRHCASHCRMAYSIRVTPPDGLGPSLEAFDNAGRGCLEVACSGPSLCGSVAPSNTLHSVWWARAPQRGPAQCRRLRCFFVGYCATVERYGSRLRP
jgi:hypothetical protein